MTKKSVTHQEIAGVIEVHRGSPMVSSLKLAELFERPHFRVLKSIRGLISRGKLTTGAVVSSWVDSTGRSNEIYLLNERSALIAAPFIGGAKAEDVQCKIVDAYLYYRDSFKNPPRREILTDKRRSGSLMCEILQELRDEAGKETQPHHYGTEYKLCNWALTGEFKPLDESTLSNEDVDLLRRIRAHNTSLIEADIPYAERKPRLAQFAIRRRTKLISSALSDDPTP